MWLGQLGRVRTMVRMWRVRLLVIVLHVLIPIILVQLVQVVIVRQPEVNVQVNRRIFVKERRVDGIINITALVLDLDLIIMVLVLVDGCMYITIVMPEIDVRMRAWGIHPVVAEGR